MSEFIDVEWYSVFPTGLPNQTIGIVLVYNDHDGFKCYMGIGNGESQAEDAKRIHEYGAKLGIAAAKGFWHQRMKAEWISRNLANDARLGYAYKYDGKRYLKDADNKTQ